MAIVKVSELQGVALDWAVGYALNGEKVFFVAFGGEMLGRRITDAAKQGRLSPSTKWERCGPLIEHFAIGFCGHSSGIWRAFSSPEDKIFNGYGETHLIAACRLIVAAKLDDEIEVPDELIGGAS